MSQAPPTEKGFWADLRALVALLPYNAYLLFMVEMVWSVGFWVPVVPFFVQCIDASEHWVAWLQALQQLGIALAGWLWGAVADIIGADAAMVTSTALCATFLIMSGCAAQNVWYFAAFRCAAGLCSKQAAVNAYIFEAVPRHLHDLAMSFRLLANTAALLLSAMMVDSVSSAGEEVLSSSVSCPGFVAVFSTPGFALLPLLLITAAIVARDRLARQQLKKDVAADTQELSTTPSGSQRAFHLLLRSSRYLALLLAMFTVGFVGSAFNVAFTNLQHDFWHSPLKQVARVSASLFLTQGLIAVFAFRPILRWLGEEGMLTGVSCTSTVCMMVFLAVVGSQFQGLAIVAYILGMGLLVQCITLGSLLSKKMAGLINPRCSGQAVGTAYGCIMFAASGSCLFTGKLYELDPRAPFYVCLALQLVTSAVLAMVFLAPGNSEFPADGRVGSNSLTAPLLNED